MFPSLPVQDRYLALSLCITQDGHSSYKIIFKKELFWGL